MLRLLIFAALGLLLFGVIAGFSQGDGEKIAKTLIGFGPILLILLGIQAVKSLFRRTPKVRD